MREQDPEAIYRRFLYAAAQHLQAAQHIRAGLAKGNLSYYADKRWLDLEVVQERFYSYLAGFMEKAFGLGPEQEKQPGTTLSVELIGPLSKQPSVWAEKLKRLHALQTQEKQSKADKKEVQGLEEELYYPGGVTVQAVLAMDIIHRAAELVNKSLESKNEPSE